MGKTDFLSRLKSLDRRRKIIAVTGLALLLYAFFGFLILPMIVKNLMVTRLTAALMRPVSIKTVRINPFALSATIGGFQLQSLDGGEDLADFSRLYVNLGAVSLFKRALIIQSLQLESPRLHLSRLSKKTYNFSDLLTLGAGGAGNGQGKKPLLFSINNIELSDGQIFFDDQPRQATHQVRDLRLAIPTVSNLRYELDNYVQPAFSAVVNGTSFNLAGRSKPFVKSRESSLGIRLDRLDLAYYLAYLPEGQGLTLKSGFLDLDADLTFVFHQGAAPTVSLAGDLILSEVVVDDLAGKTYLEFPRLEIGIAGSNLLQRKLRLSRVVWQQPRLLVEQAPDESILPLALVAVPPAETEDRGTTEDESAPVILQVENFSLRDGAVRFVDQRGSGFDTTLASISLQANGISTREGADRGGFSLSLQSEAGEGLAVTGDLGLKPFATSGRIEISAASLPKYQQYLNRFIRPVAAGGLVDLVAEFNYAAAEGNQVLKVSDLSIQLSGLDLRQDGAGDPVAAIDELAIVGSVDLRGHELVVNSISTAGGRFRVVRGHDGRVNFQDLLQSREAGGTPSESAESAAGQVKWQARLLQASVSDYQFDFIDNLPATPATTTVADLSLSVADLANIPESNGTLEAAFRFNDQGRVDLKGRLGIEPLTAVFDIKLQDIAIANLQPYLNQAVDLAITDGSLDLTGSSSLSVNHEKKTAFRFDGDVVVKSFKSLDPVTGNDFFAWQELRFDGIGFVVSPLSVEVKEIAWQGAVANLVVNPDGSLNLAHIKKGDGGETGDAEPVPATDNERPTIKISTVALKDGQINFLDQSIAPSYAFQLAEINGKISGLSSLETAEADLSISGKLDQHAPLQVTGRINPLKEKIFADLKVDFNDIELSPTSPYAGKYIGYKIDKGKLFLDLAYKVDGTVLQGENRARLDQFTLGETVDSPDAVSLPISLAIALLKNRNGEITLDIPVRGNLDDPDFSLGGVIFNIIVNLIAKAATSPFALLGALIPAGEDLQQVVFEPGGAIVDQEGTDKLETLAKVLFERPALRMDLVGSADPQSDMPALKRMQLEKLLVLQKIKAAGGGTAKSPPAVEVTVSDDERQRLVEQLFAGAGLKEPTGRRQTDEEKRQRFAEMEQLLLDSIAVEPDALRLLAVKRAEEVKSLLAGSGKVEPERLFIVEPKAGVSDTSAEAPLRQVQIRIK